MPIDFDIGDGADALGRNQLSDALDGTYWVSGWDATLGTGALEVDIAAGSGAINGGDVSTGSTQTVDFTGDPDSTEPRKAVISVDDTGTVQKTLGAPTPAGPADEIRFRTYDPAPPTNGPGVVVAEVWLAAGETSLESADVRDRRVTNDASINATPNTPGWVEDGNSPFVVNSQVSATYTLASSYDQVLLLADPSKTGFDGLRVNGDSTNNYEAVTNADVTETDTEWRIQRAQFREYIKLMSFSGRAIGMSIKSADATSGVVNSGDNINVNPPITQFTLLDTADNARSTTIRVYGWNAE